MEKITIKSKKYPGLLKKIYDPPQELHCYGNIQLLEKRCIAIVGTRKLSNYGKYVINQFLTEKIKDLNIVIVSGLALGTDAYVHSMCLRHGIKTIGVVPGGLTTAVPEANRGILEKIIENGLVIAEFSPDVTVGKWMFVQRNRIIAGLSTDCVVIEAGIGSGSLITASFATDSNRNVYAVPGNINSETSAGCNEIIKQGAEPLTSVEDFYRILGLEEGDQMRLSSPHLDKSI